MSPQFVIRCTSPGSESTSFLAFAIKVSHLLQGKTRERFCLEKKSSFRESAMGSGKCLLFVLEKPLEISRKKALSVSQKWISAIEVTSRAGLPGRQSSHFASSERFLREPRETRRDSLESHSLAFATCVIISVLWLNQMRLDVIIVAIPYDSCAITTYGRVCIMNSTRYAMMSPGSAITAVEP